MNFSLLFQNKIFKRLWLLSLILPISVLAVTGEPLDPFSYEPGVANPLSPYLTNDGLKGPLMLIALNPKGEITQTSRIRYDNNGRIQSETFYDDKNNLVGEIKYTFEKGLVTKEEYFDEKGNSVTAKTRVYFQGKLQQLKVHENKTLKFTRGYRYTKDRISVSETIDKQSDVFHIQLDSKGRPTSLELADEQKKPLQKIEYKYGKDDQLIERIKTLPDAAFKCAYEYDDSGRLYQYVYYDKKGTDWIKTKTIRLVYPDRI
ncbi:MAG: hypothetical protein H3C43_08280 [Leptonema sp. (in: Bacteria)]|nr:hypothetical protein [Leptonema sp. (in: bacteria)]